MSGPSAKAEQTLRRDVLRSDQQSKLRPGEHEPSTMHAMSRLSNDLEGRQSARDYLSGSEPATHYPLISSGPWSSSYGRLPDEPPLGVAIDAQEPCGEPFEMAASIAALSATASAPVANVVAGTAGGAPSASSPDVVATPASSLISSASASQDAEGGRDRAHQPTARGSVSSPTLSRRSVRKL